LKVQQSLLRTARPIESTANTTEDSPTIESKANTTEDSPAN